MNEGNHLMSDQPSAPNTPSRTNPFAWFRASRQNTIIGSSILLIGCCACGGIANAGNHGSTNGSIATVASATPHVTLTLVATKSTTPATAGATLTIVPSATPAPAPSSTPAPAPPTMAPARATNTPTPAYPAVGGNPWDYTLTNTGHLIYSPPGNFCDIGAFHCIASFWSSTNGYVDECHDGMYSHSGGIVGACSKHGGEAQPLYQP